MADTIPAGILDLQGRQSTTAPIVLMEWLLPTPQYYSSREAVIWNGHTWEGNRLKSFPSFTLGIFDRKGREFPKLDITLSNLANDGSSSFPMQQLDAAHELEQFPVKIYFYSPEAGAGFLRWAGYSGRPSYKGADKSVSLSCTFIFDSLNIPFPFRTQADLGFAALDTNQNKASNTDTMIPLVWGDGPDLAMRPTIYSAWAEAGLLHLNIIVTGCNDGLPLDANVITKALLDTTPATVIEFGGLGTAGQAAPANLTRFPDGEAHPRVAYFYAVFPLPDELKDSLDSLDPQAVKIWLANFRPLKSTGEPSENHALLLQDLLTDTYFSLGLAPADFDADVLLDTENYVGTRYRARLELHESMPLMDLLQKILGDCHCYFTFADKIQLRAKRNDEVAVATFATSDSGQVGRKIVNDFIEQVDEEDSSTLLNDVLFTYRKKNRHYGFPIHVYDPNAQSFTPGQINKPTREEIESLTLQYEDEARISAAILVREEISGNLFHKFTVPFWDGVAADDGTPLVPGRVIAVYATDIFGNGSNYLFRILTQTFDPSTSHISFKCKVYKPAIYNDDADGIGVDLLRGGQDTSRQGRPPDVIPVSVAIVDIDTGDPSGILLTVEAKCTIPLHDPADDLDKGIVREPPIAAVAIYYRRTDEPVNSARHGATAEVQQSTEPFEVSAQFDVPYHKNRTVEVSFVALPPSRVKSPVGYIRDVTKVTHLTAELSATAITASVASETPFTVGDYVIIEKEFLKVLSKAPLTFVNGAGHRTPQLNSVSIIHPVGIEVAVAKKSYPTLDLLLAIRKTFLNVTGLAADQEDDGVRFHWTSVEVDNLDYYLIYTCQDVDALTNPAKLGSTNPVWFAADPEEPPAGITVNRTAHTHFKVPATEIAANVTVAGRAAAKNHKGNYSSLLSNSATNKSTGHGVVPLFAPSDPNAGDIISLGVPSEIAHKQIPVTFRIWADGADHTKKFDDGGSDRTGFFYAPPSAADPTLPDLTRIAKLHQNITDTNTVSANVTKWFPIGQKFFWLQNFNSNGSGKTTSNQITNITFVPGDYNADPANLTTFTITVTPINDKYSKVDVHIVQPSVGHPVLLKNLWFYRKLPTDPDYISQDDKTVHLHSDTANSQLSADLHFYAEIKHPAGVTGISYKALIVAQGGLSRFVTTSANSSADPDVPIDTGVIPGTPGAPTFAKVKKNGAHVRTPVPAAATNRASWSHNLLVIASANAPANGVTVLTASDLTTGTVLSSSNDAAGQIEMGRKKTTVEIDRGGLEAVFGAGATIYFWFYWVNDFGLSARSTALSYNLATGEFGPVANDSAAPTVGAAPDVQEYFGNFLVSCPRPTANFNTLDDYQVILSTQNTAPAGNPSVGSEGVQKIKYGQSVVFKRKLISAHPTVYIYYRPHNQYNGGSYSTSWSAGTSISGDVISRPLEDGQGTAVPPLPMGFERAATGGSTGNDTTHYYLDASASAVANAYVGTTEREFYLYISTLATADQVRKITAYDEVNKKVTVTPAWSGAPGNALSFEIHRGLVTGGKSGTSHGTTTFKLDSGDSAVDDYYNGMMLYIPSAASGQQLQKITDYVGSTKTCTIEPGANQSALSGAPANNCGYMLSQGGFGFANSDGTGRIAPVPVRVWLNTETSQNIPELILPTGENAFGLTNARVKVIRHSNGAVRYDETKAVSTAPKFNFDALSYVGGLAVQFQSSYRGTDASPSDGLSELSYYAEIYKSTDAPTAFAPGSYPSVVVDYEARSNYPNSHYPVY